MAAADDPVVVGQCSVVLNAPSFRPLTDFPGGLRPFLDGLGVAVVHLEAEDAAITAIAEMENTG